MLPSHPGHPPVESASADKPRAFDLGDLKAGAVHTWQFSIGTALNENLMQALRGEDAQRASLLGSPMAQARFLTARAVTRLVIGRYLQAPPRSFRIDTDPYGKPGLTGSSGAGGLAFNLSHTGGKGMLALACDRRLGIDVQDWRQVRDAAGLVRRCFAESEQAYWFDLEFSRREAELFRLWALKEAFCKAVGRGLALGLNRCVFDCRGTRPRLVSAPEAADGIGQWHFAELALPTGTSGAIACDRGISKLRRFMFEHPARF